MCHHTQKIIAVKETHKTRGHSLVVECLPDLHKGLSLMSGTANDNIISNKNQCINFVFI